MAELDKPKKKVKLSRLLLVLFPIFLMSGSVLAIYITGQSVDVPPQQNVPAKYAENAFQVGEYTFYINQEGDFWTYSTLNTGEVIPIAFRLDPRNAGEIYFEPEVLRTIKTSGKIYTAYNPNDEDISRVIVAVGEVSRLLPIIVGFTSIDAFSEDMNPINPNVPVKTCEDAVGTTTVILFEVSNDTGVYSDGNCVIVRGKTHDDLILAADKLGMQLIGLNV